MSVRLTTAFIVVLPQRRERAEQSVDKGKSSDLPQESDVYEIAMGGLSMCIGHTLFRHLVPAPVPLPRALRPLNIGRTLPTKMARIWRPPPLMTWLPQAPILALPVDALPVRHRLTVVRAGLTRVYRPPDVVVPLPPVPLSKS